MASPDLFFQVFTLLFFLARNVLDGSSGRGFSRLLLSRLKRQRASLEVLMWTFFWRDECRELGRWVHGADGRRDRCE